ncbi:MAG: SPW repeat protein [Candidatus Baltobacteraceae bacterium]
MQVPNRVPWVNVAVGILAIISPYLFTGTSSGARWDMTITGIVIAVVAIIAMSVQDKVGHNYWPVINVLAGIWLIISTTFVQGETAMVWSNVVLGVVAIVTSVVSLSYERIHMSSGQHIHT